MTNPTEQVSKPERWGRWSRLLHKWCSDAGIPQEMLAVSAGRKRAKDGGDWCSVKSSKMPPLDDIETFDPKVGVPLVRALAQRFGYDIVPARQAKQASPLERLAGLTALGDVPKTYAEALADGHVSLPEIDAIDAAADRGEAVVAELRAWSRDERAKRMAPGRAK